MCQINTMANLSRLSANLLEYNFERLLFLFIFIVNNFKVLQSKEQLHFIFHILLDLSYF